MSKLLTNLIFEPKGKHDPTKAYTIKDTVMSSDGSRVYFALQDVPVGVELTDTTYWKLQIDLSATKAEAEAATAAANAAAETANTAAANVREDVDRLSEEIVSVDGRIFEKTAAGTHVADIPGSTAKTGWSADIGVNYIGFATNSNFDSYWFVTDKDIDVWFGNVPAYAAVCVGEGFANVDESIVDRLFLRCEGETARYRNIDGNLPSESSKLHIPAGSAVAFTVTGSEMMDVYGICYEKNVKASFKAEILEDESVIVEYTSNSGENQSPNGVNVYIPSNDGYIKYAFVHTVYTAINVDVWRVSNAYMCDKLLVVQYPITTLGEWECAVHLADRDDFSGGRMHGDEVMTDIAFFVDGVQTTPENMIGRIGCGELRIVQKSHLYDPADHTTQIAVHTSEHIFTNSKNGRDLVINQTVKWLGSYDLTSCFLAMFPIAKAVSDTMYSDVDYTPVPIVNNTSIPEARKACLFSDNVFAVFGVDKYVDDMQGFLVTDNGADDYNKCYYVVCNVGTANPNTLWQTSAYYSIKATI